MGVAPPLSGPLCLVAAVGERCNDNLREEGLNVRARACVRACVSTGAIVRCASTDAAVNANLVLRANNAREELPANPLEIDLTPASPHRCSPIQRLDKWPMEHVDPLSLED